MKTLQPRIIFYKNNFVKTKSCKSEESIYVKKKKKEINEHEMKRGRFKCADNRSKSTKSAQLLLSTNFIFAIPNS